MPQISDETLMLYADGLLDASLRAAVEERLALEPSLRARLNVFLVTGQRLASLFDDHIAATPARLQWLVSAHQETAKARASKKRLGGTGLGTWIARLLEPKHEVFRFSLASVAILVVGVGAGWILHGLEKGRQVRAGNFVVAAEDGLFAEGPLRSVLNSLPSGKNAEIAGVDGGGPFRFGVRLSFKDHSGDYCREYELGGSANAYAGVACNDKGRWRIQVQALVSPQSVNAASVKPAGNGQGHAPVESVVMSLIDGESLGLAEEEALIQNGWRK